MTAPFSLTGLASRIRDGWFGLLGSTQGFPYNANLFFVAYFTLTLSDSGGIPYPVTFTLSILDSSGNVAGAATATASGEPLIMFAVNGSFDLTQTYAVELVMNSPGTGYSFVATARNGTEDETGALSFVGTSFIASTDSQFIAVAITNPPPPVPAGQQDAVTPVQETGPSPVT